MTTTFKRLLSLILILISALAFLPKLSAYTPESIALDISIRTPSGIDYQNTLPTPLGNNVSVSLDGLYPSLDFVYFIHEGNTYTNQSMQFTASGSTKVTAIYKEPNTYTLTYLDTNNDIIDVIYGEQENFEVTLPLTNPSKPGYNFIGWDTPNEVAEDVIVRPIYEKITNTVAVTVNNQVTNYNYNEVVTLSPTNPNFSYWADEDGQVVSTNPNYRFSVLMPRLLNEVSNVTIDIKPRIYLSNVTGIREGFISLLGYIDHPRANIIEYGILASASEHVLTILNSTKIPSQSLADTNEFLRTFEGDTYKSFRAYAILSNNTIIYSDNNHYIKLTESYTEYFSTTGLTAPYSDITFNGSSGTVWEAFHARNEETYAINGSGLMLRRASDSYLRITFPNGLDKLSFDYRKAFTNADVRQLEIIANGNVIHTTPVFGNISGEDSTIHKVNLSNLNLLVNTVIIIKNIGSTSTNRQVVIDNFKWTEKVEPNVIERLQQVKFNYLNQTETKTVYFGNNVVEPTLPELDTHTFVGWYTDSNFNGQPYDLEEPILGNVELFAKWELIASEDEVVTYNIDFGASDVLGYAGESISFTNTWNNQLTTLNKLRFQINTLNSNVVGVLSPISTDKTSYVEFDLTILNLETNIISFDFVTWSNIALTNLLNSNRDTFFALQVYMHEDWVTLETTEGHTNLKNILTEALQTVYYNVPGNYNYRVLLSTPGVYSNTTNTAQAAIIDNFKAIHISSAPTLNPIFIVPDALTYFAEQDKAFEEPVLYALDRFGRYIEANLISGYDLSVLGTYELIYEAIDFDGLATLYSVTLEVIEELPLGELPEMDETVLQPLKDQFQSDRNALPAQLNLPYSPETYYASLNGLTGQQFKTALQNLLVNSHIRPISYGEARFVLEQSDAVTIPQGTYLYGIYSSHNIVRYWDGGSTWNREHVWPNSKLGIPRVNNSSRNLGSDVHNLRVINPSVNSSRSNRYFDIGPDGSFTTIGTEAYDPGIDHRGDVARILFYMYIRYNDVLDLSNIVSEILAGSSYSTSNTMGILNVLIQWHQQDPVSDFERDRNEVIYQYQGNRNPFIDNPSYVGMLFS